jgi:ribonuclease E
MAPLVASTLPWSSAMTGEPSIAVTPVQSESPASVAQAAQTPEAAIAQPPQTESAAPDATVPSSTASAMPKVSNYDLPLDSLQAVANNSGLQWVNSDPVRIAAVQAAIAAEAPAVHPPRERPAPLKVQGGPLVLVETKRDLRALNLPLGE